MNEYNPIVVFIAAILALLTTVISLRTLKNHPVLSNPVISVCVGLLAFMGLCDYAGKELSMVILPYIALALCLPIVLFLLLFARSSKEQRPDARDRRACNSQKKDDSESAEWHGHASSMDQEHRYHENDERTD